MKSLYKFIKKLDIFGQSFNFKLKSSTKSNTFIGGFFTISSIILIIGASYSTGNDIYERTKPIVSIEEKLSLKRPMLELNNKTFPISVILQDYNMNNYFLPNYFSFEIIYSHIINANATVTQSIYPLVKCQLSHFPNFKEEYFNKVGLGNYYCIDNQNFTISGYWDEITLDYVTVRIRMCNNQTDGGNCAPKEEIEAFIDRQPVAWSLFFQDSIINTQVNGNEIINFIKITYKNLRKQTYKMFSLYVREQELITDTGIILEDTSSKVTLNIEHTDYDDSDITVDKIYCDMMIYSSNQKTIYRRKYIKVQNILADVGGLTKALFMISTILTYFISIVKQKEKLINNLFDLNEISNNIKNFSNKIYDNPEKINVSNNNFIGQSSNFNPIIKTENNIKPIKLKFSICEIIKMFICKCCLKNNLKKKVLYYNKGEQSIERVIDVCYILKKIQDVNKLKLILFDDYQIAMFERYKKFNIDNPEGLLCKKRYEEALINKSNYLQSTTLSIMDRKLKENCI